MSIAITAPQKFDFQNVVCVEIMLRFAGSNGARFLVEPEDGEYGELHFPSSTGGSRIEKPVKGAFGTVTLASALLIKISRHKL